MGRDLKINVSTNLKAAAQLRKFARASKTPWAKGTQYLEPIQENVRTVLLEHPDLLIEVVTTTSLYNHLVPFDTPWNQVLYGLVEEPNLPGRPWVISEVGELPYIQFMFKKQFWKLRGAP